MSIPVRRRKSEAGQAILLVVLAMSIFLLGAVGFAIDGSHLYAQRQMAQAAADAAAQAAILSVFNGSNGSGGNAFLTVPNTTYTCNTSDARTPCYYAQTMNGFNSAQDVVTYVANPSGVTYPNLSASDPTNILRVTVTRQVQTTLMRLLGPSVSTIGASATAAILSLPAAVPVLVTDPVDPGTFTVSIGSPTLNVCGSASRGIQVNSSDANSVTSSSSATITLGCGASLFGSFGTVTLPPSIALASGTFVAPASPIADPFAGVAPPPVPTAAPGKVPLGNGLNGCPAAPVYACNLYSPGLYATGITLGNETAVFKPGIYYMTSGGLSSTANGSMLMATGFVDPGTGWAGNALFYSTGGGTFNIAPTSLASSVTLVGAPAGSPYQDILFFEDRGAAAATHQLGLSNGFITLTGTIYLPAANQTLNLQGGSGGTIISGDIVVGALSLGQSNTTGIGGITVNLDPPSFPARQVALVN